MNAQKIHIFKKKQKFNLNLRYFDTVTRSENKH